MSEPPHAPSLPPDLEALVGTVVDAVEEVHDLLGPGLLERVYVECLAHELTTRGCRVARDVPAPVTFKDLRLDLGYRIGLLVDEQVVVEVKGVDFLDPVHFAQVVTFLRHAGAPVGLLVNFHEPRLSDGLHRLLADDVE